MAGFELQVKSPALTGIPSDEKAADLKYVGTTPNALELHSIGDDPFGCNGGGQCGLEYFAISTYRPWHTAASQNEYDIYIDSNGDGVPDTVTFNTRLTPSDNVFVTETIDLNSGDTIDAELINDRSGGTDTALFDNDTLVMPGRDRRVPLPQHGGKQGLVVTLDDSLTVSKSGAGSGSVWSVPAGIDCGTICSHTFADGTSVALTATAAAGSTFTGWSGGGCSGTGTCQVTLNAATTVTATFQPNFTLSVTKGGSGSGSVTSSPAGIDCGATCSHDYAGGTAVTLTATAGSRSKFAGWSGGGCSGTGACQVTLTAATSVKATFNKKRDTTRPRVTSVKVKVNHGKRTAKVTFRATDPGHGSKGLRFKCKLDRHGFKSCRSPKLYKHLRHGKHTVQVEAIDKAGNVSKPVKRRFKV